MDLVDAQQARRSLGPLGRLFDFANFVEKVKKGLSAGRCSLLLLSSSLTVKMKSMPFNQKNTGQLMVSLRREPNNFRLLSTV